MERLTKKEKKVVLLNNRNIGKNYLTIKQYEKLQQLENIEEELGIDLITLFKALKEGIYYLEEGNIFFSNDVNLWCGTSKNYYISGAGIYKKVKDYGKTWWLEKPKEELEND